MITVFENFHPDNGEGQHTYSYTEEQRQAGLQVMLDQVIKFHSIVFKSKDGGKDQTLWLSDLIYSLENHIATEVMFALIDRENDPVEALELLRYYLICQIEFEYTNDEIDYYIYIEDLL